MSVSHVQWVSFTPESQMWMKRLWTFTHSSTVNGKTIVPFSLQSLKTRKWIFTALLTTMPGPSQTRKP